MSGSLFFFVLLNFIHHDKHAEISDTKTQDVVKHSHIMIALIGMLSQFNAYLYNYIVNRQNVLKST